MTENTKLIIQRLKYLTKHRHVCPGYKGMWICSGCPLEGDCPAEGSGVLTVQERLQQYTEEEIFEALIEIT